MHQINYVYVKNLSSYEIKKAFLIKLTLETICCTALIALENNFIEYLKNLNFDCKF